MVALELSIHFFVNGFLVLGKINVQAIHSFNQEHFFHSRSLAFLLMHNVLVYLDNIKTVSYTDTTTKAK